MLIITGTGRSGTSVFSRWFDELGLLPYKFDWSENFRSGGESPDVDRVNSAIWLGNDSAMQSIPAQKEAINGIDYSIIKDPKFFYGNVLDTWLSVRRDLKFLICVRNFGNVHRSRISAGHLTQARKPEELQMDFGKFLSQIIFNNIEYEIVCFPQFLDSYQECYTKVLRLQPDLKIDLTQGRKAWNRVVDKSLVHF